MVVEQHDEPTAGLAGTGIVTAGEAAILVEGDQSHPRKSLADERGGAVSRSVVDEDRLGVDALLRGDGVQTRLEILPAVPADDHD